jgi:hypothetical protein
MSTYRITLVGGGSGFKVHVADNSDGLRVVGVFVTEAEANEWIAADSRVSGSPAKPVNQLLVRQE